jgi:hypothetical protein
MLQAGGETLLSEIHKLIISVSNEEELPHQWKEFIVLPIYKTGIKLTVIIIVVYCSYQFHTTFYPISFS